MDIITIDSIINHGTVVQVLGHDADGHVRSVVGDWRPMLAAIDGLGLEPGSTVAVIDTAEGEALCDPADVPADCERDGHGFPADDGPCANCGPR